MAHGRLHGIVRVVSLVVMLFGVGSQPDAALALIVNFESVPVLSTGPSLFSQAGAMQTIDVNGVATFSGGVVVGFPTNFPASPFSTAPNVYGTGSLLTGGHLSLTPSISMSISPTLGATIVEGLLFNGLTQPVSYTVNAFSGSTLVDSVSFPNLQSNLSSGFSIFRLNSGGPSITSVLFNPDRTGTFGQWDYVIDTIAIGEHIENAAPVPVPGAVWLFGSGLASVIGLARRKITG